LILARYRATLGHLLHRATDHIDQLKARVRSLSPQHTLNRGYAVVHHNNTILRDTAEVDVGDNLDILVAAGRLGATTTSVAETTQEQESMTDNQHSQPAVTGFSTADVSDVAAMTYEQARTELIQTVERLEAGGAGLEESLALWERGEALARRCEAWLEGARTRLAEVRAEPETPQQPDQ